MFLIKILRRDEESVEVLGDFTSPELVVNPLFIPIRRSLPCKCVVMTAGLMETDGPKIETCKTRFQFHRNTAKSLEDCTGYLEKVIEKALRRNKDPKRSLVSRVGPYFAGFLNISIESGGVKIEFDFDRIRERAISDFCTVLERAFDGDTPEEMAVERLAPYRSDYLRETIELLEKYENDPRKDIAMIDGKLVVMRRQKSNQPWAQRQYAQKVLC